jgi:hypothetical protein
MARTKIEIKSVITTELDSLNLSTSLYAIWNLITDAVVSVIYVFELILDIFKADIEEKISEKRIGSLTWYIEKAKEFQLGDNITFFENGTIGYPVIDEEKQIIAFATATEGGNTVYIKVAKIESDELIPLSTEELLQFSNYMQKIMIAGTSLECVSLIADSIHVVADIYYNAIYSEAQITDNLNVALLNYKVNKEDSLFVKNDFIEMLRNVEGINDAEITLLEGIQGLNTVEIAREYEVIAGYFNWDATNLYTLIPDA